MPEQDFSTLPLKPALISNLVTLNYHKMTPIQAQSLPIILENKDLIAQAKTGSGKTAAFGLGLLNQLDESLFQPQALIICPTRELGQQVADEIRRLGRNIPNIKVVSLCGGVPLRVQLGSLEHGAHIIVGTPGRLQEHLRKESFETQALKTLVLDEADRMLEMGFQPQIEAIISDLSNHHNPRQTLLFSATFPDNIKTLAKKVLSNPAQVKVESTHENHVISQHFYKVNNDAERQQALLAVLLQEQPTSTLVFCNTKKEVREVADYLKQEGFSVLALHGDLEQKERDLTLIRFSHQSCSVLVATDVASRGLDIDHLEAVINFHIARDPEVHIHRIGRTGRAGNQGLACSFYQDKEHYKIEQLETALQQKVISEPLSKIGLHKAKRPKPAFVTLQLDAGKKQKIRPGDILGALTGEGGIKGNQVGKITLKDFRAYVSVTQNASTEALKKLNEGKLKGRKIRAWRL